MEFNCKNTPSLSMGDCFGACLHIEGQASERVASYASSNIRKIQNPKPERFCQIVSAFDKEWGLALQEFFKQEGRGDAVISVMNNRHKIAHGEDVNITVQRVREYFDKSIEVLEFLENQVLKR